jgi:hypothetical protein
MKVKKLKNTFIGLQKKKTFRFNTLNAIKTSFYYLKDIVNY